MTTLQEKRERREHKERAELVKSLKKLVVLVEFYQRDLGDCLDSEKRDLAEAKELLERLK